MFLYFVASNCLCRFSSGLTDVHMDTSTKLATFSLEEEVLTEYIPKHVKLCGYNLYFTTSRLYLHLNCFLNLWRATRIRAFPKNAVMDKKALMTERKMSSPCTSPVNSAEHKNSATVCRLSPLVKFCISKTFLRCGYSQLNSFLIHLSSLYDNRQSTILVLPLCCRAIREQISTIGWLLENELNIQ